MGAARQAKRDRTEEVVDRLLEVAPDAIVVMGADGRMVRVNTQAEKLFGYSREELLGQKPDLLMPCRRRERRVKHRSSRVAQPRFRPLGHGLEVLARRRDGTEFPVEINLSFLDIGAETLILSAFGTSSGSGPKS
jgi:protein-histidine pros-kinase